MRKLLAIGLGLSLTWTLTADVTLARHGGSRGGGQRGMQFPAGVQQNYLNSQYRAMQQQWLRSWMGAQPYGYVNPQTGANPFVGVPQSPLVGGMQASGVGSQARMMQQQRKQLRMRAQQSGSGGQCGAMQQQRLQMRTNQSGAGAAGGGMKQQLRTRSRLQQDCPLMQ